MAWLSSSLCTFSLNPSQTLLHWAPNVHLHDHYWHRPALKSVFIPSPTSLLEHSPKNSIDSTYSWPHHPVCFTPSLGLSQTELELNFVFATKQQGELLIACFSSAKYMNEVIQVNNAQQTEAQWLLALSSLDFALGCLLPPKIPLVPGKKLPLWYLARILPQMSSVLT